MTTEAQMREQLKQRLGAYADLHPDFRNAHTFSALLSDIFRRPRAEEMLGADIAQQMAAVLDAHHSAAEQMKPLVKAVQAVIVAIDTNKSQGGDLGKRINKANPLTVESLRQSLATIEQQEKKNG